MHGIRKAFPGVVALDGVDLEVRRGEVHVLLGENGAGKSTLMKVLSGALQKDAGDIELDGRPVHIGSPREAQQLGIRTIYQELTLVPYLSSAENIFLGREPRRLPGVIDCAPDAASRPSSSSNASACASTRGGPSASWASRSSRWWRSPRPWTRTCAILIMDEPTSALTDSEITELFATIERLTARGTAIIYISHRLEEVARVGHVVTVMRDGRRVATHRVGDVPSRPSHPADGGPGAL